MVSIKPLKKEESALVAAGFLYSTPFPFGLSFFFLASTHLEAFEHTQLHA